MINRARMLLDDIDSEGFPIPYPPSAASLGVLNVGRSADHAIVQALLADHKCLSCAPPRDNVGLSVVQDHLADVASAREMVRDADQHMALRNCHDADRTAAYWDGITRLSDSIAPDAYFGWKR